MGGREGGEGGREYLCVCVGGVEQYETHQITYCFLTTASPFV